MRFKPNGFSNDTPMYVAGVGGGQPVRWLYTDFGQFLNVWGKNNNVDITFNLKSQEDIDTKLNILREMVRKGLLAKDDLAELEERVRMLSNFSCGGNGSHTSAATISEAHAKGVKYKVYQDGQLVEKVGRGKRKFVSKAMIKALAEARKRAHSEEANAKRRKSIEAKRLDKEVDSE